MRCSDAGVIQNSIKTSLVEDIIENKTMLRVWSSALAWRLLIKQRQKNNKTNKRKRKQKSSLNRIWTKVLIQEQTTAAVWKQTISLMDWVTWYFLELLTLFRFPSYTNKESLISGKISETILHYVLSMDKMKKKNENRYVKKRKNDIWRYQHAFKEIEGIWLRDREKKNKIRDR